MAFVALVPLVLAVRGHGPGAAFFLGWLGGLLTLLVGFHWLPDVLADFSSLPRPAAWATALALHVYQAGRFGLCAGLFAWATRRGFPRAVALLAAHATAELLYPLPFPWYFGAAVHGVPLLIQVADLGGPIAVSLLVVCGNALVAELALDGHPAHSAGASWRLSLPGLDGLLVPGGLLGLGLSYGALRQEQVQAELAGKERLRVGIVQANVSRRDESDRRAALARNLALSRELTARDRVDLLVWSESAVKEPVRQAIASQHFEASFTRTLGVPLLFGAILSRRGEAGTPTFLNSAFLSDRNGEICPRCRYDKQLLFPLGEFLPGERWFPWLRRYFESSGRFEPGPRAAPLMLHGHRVAAAICFEDAHPTLVNGMDQVELLINLTNDAWFEGTSAPTWHLVLAKFRAVEQRRFLVRATNTGVSGIIDPTGAVSMALPESQSAAASGDVRFLNGTTLFQSVGEKPWWLIAFVTLLVPWRRRASAALPAV